MWACDTICDTKFSLKLGDKKGIKMGSFLGHILPGLYFLILGSWGSFNCSRNFSISRYQRNAKFVICLSSFWNWHYIRVLFLFGQQSEMADIKIILLSRQSEKAGYRNKASHQGSFRFPCESLLKLSAFSVQLVFSTMRSSSSTTWSPATSPWAWSMVYCESILKSITFPVQLVFSSSQWSRSSIKYCQHLQVFSSGWRAGYRMGPQRDVEQCKPLGNDHFLHGKHPLRNWILL